MIKRNMQIPSGENPVFLSFLPRVWSFQIAKMSYKWSYSALKNRNSDES